MVWTVFAEVFAADVFVAVFPICAAYITALVAEKFHFVFLLRSEGRKLIEGFVKAEVGDYIGKVVTVKLADELGKISQDFCGRGNEIQMGVILFDIREQQVGIYYHAVFGVCILGEKLAEVIAFFVGEVLLCEQ